MEKSNMTDIEDKWFKWNDNNNNNKKIPKVKKQTNHRVWMNEWMIGNTHSAYNREICASVLME